MLNGAVRAAAVAAPAPAAAPTAPGSIFVLRNNDLGDVIIITPLFDALRRRFPDSAIIAGVGAWSAPILRGNPHVSEVLELQAPFHNKYLSLPVDGRAKSLATNDLRAMRYLAHSPEIALLRKRRFDVGIDVLGSAWGELLLMRAHIPYRIGVGGYEGGEPGAAQTVPFDHREHVGRTALRLAEALGAVDLPSLQPQIFLTPAEREGGEAAWRAAGAGQPRQRLRIVLAAGGGLPEKCWPLEHFVQLTRLIDAVAPATVVIVGGAADRESAATIAGASPNATTRAGSLSLRDTFALLAAADMVVTNASMVMHAAAAFGVPTVVTLSSHFDSAAAHDRQWGYPTCRSVGRGSGTDRILTPPEVLEAMQDLHVHLRGEPLRRADPTQPAGTA